jgi:hypothetical protein
MRVGIEFLEFIWYQRLFESEHLRSLQGQRIELISVFKPRHPSSYCLHLVKLKIQGISVEGSAALFTSGTSTINQLPILSKKHILLVVYQWESHQSPPIDLPVIEILPIIRKNSLQRYQRLLSSKATFSCQDIIHRIDPIYRYFWLGRMTIEDLEHQVVFLQKKLFYLKGHWEAWCTYTLLMHFLDFSEEHFLSILYKIPFTEILKHQKHPDQLYLFLSERFYPNPQLEDPSSGNQSSFYAIPNLQDSSAHPNKKVLLGKIAWLVLIFCDQQPLMDRILQARHLEDVIRLFPNKKDALNSLPSAYSFISLVEFPTLRKIVHTIINKIVPMLFLFGKLNKENVYIYRSLSLLESIHYEQSNDSEMHAPWKQPFFNAADHNALLYMKLHYCELNRCLHCTLGQQYIQFG